MECSERFRHGFVDYLGRALSLRSSNPRLNPLTSIWSQRMHQPLRLFDDNIPILAFNYLKWRYLP